MLRIFAILFGIAFVFVGVAGLIPSFYSNGYLFGFFEVDLMHNVAHIATGVLAIMAATSHQLAKKFFILFGIIYTVLAIVGFARGGDLYMMHVNMSDSFLHLGVGVLALALGFGSKRI